MRKNTFIVIPIVLGLLFCSTELDAKKPNPKKSKSTAVEVTVTGTVMINNEGASGQATSVSLEVEVGEEQYEYYYVVMDGSGKELLDQVDNIVSITGTVKEDIVKKKLLTVKSWRLIKEISEEQEGPGELSPDTEEESNEGANDDTIEL